MTTYKKKKKMKSIGQIRRRIFRLWSDAVLSRTDWTCEYCGIKKGDINKNGKKEKIDAHHLFSRDIKDAILKFDIRNGIAVCPTCHKWGANSFHRNPITTITWFQNNFQDRYAFILENWNIRIDLDNRYVLSAIEMKLKDKLPLDINELQEIEIQHPRHKKQKIEMVGSLWENLQESSSSSE
jgi:hypothetical protein